MPAYQLYNAVQPQCSLISVIIVALTPCFLDAGGDGGVKINGRVSWLERAEIVCFSRPLADRLLPAEVDPFARRRKRTRDSGAGAAHHIVTELRAGLRNTRNP